MFASSKSGAVADPKDSKFNYVTMLLHGNGTNGAQNNTFVDSSTNNFTITRNGNTTQGTFSPYGSNWSNYFDGTTDYLTAPANAAFGFGTGDFTAECWVYPVSWVGLYDGFISTLNSGTAVGIHLSRDGVEVNGVATAWGTTLSLNTWTHLALTRSGTTLRLFVNGALTNSGTNSANIGSSSAFAVGRRLEDVSNYYCNAYISNARIVKGTAVYTSAFTPSITPLTAISGTSVLTCQSSRFIDSSTNNFTITRNGDVSVQRFSPFNATSTYSTSVIGGSGYFDGTGDSLKVAYSSQMDLTNQDFAIEFWIYLPAQLSNRSILCQDQSNYQLNAYVDTGGNLTFYSYQSNGTENFNVPMGATPVGAWSHLVIARTGSTIAGFRNGVRIATASFNGTVNAQTGGWYIGAVYSNLNQITGYLSDVRFVIGSNPYGVGTTLTVPTAPLTAITNTRFLASFSNAAILDNAMMSDLETVGNAQISTSVKKYGTGSISFDATADRLVAASSPNIAFGTGDFTVEFWLNSNNVASANQRGVIQTSDTSGGLKAGYTTGIAIYQGGNATGGALNGGITANVAGTFLGSSSAVITTSTWYHIALVRSSGTSTIYVNGTSVGSATTTGNCSGQFVCVGGYYDTTYLYDGYLDDLRITKGFARYTSNFTAPTAAFPDKG
jgi:hypothetical protein